MNEPSGASMPRSDADLLNAIRSGEPGPYDLLWARHGPAARRVARHLVADQATADDVVARASAQVRDAISRGGGPTDAFRPYLLTAVRRTAHDGTGAGAQLPVDEQQLPDPGQLPATGAAALPAIVAAFLSLPERWRAVLWQTAVEGATPVEAARLLGLPEAGAAELTDQARAGLARAYRPPRQAAAGQDRASGAAPQAARAGTGAASAALRDALAPLVLGEAAAAYLAELAGPADSRGAGPRPGPGSAPAASWLPGRPRDAASRQRMVAAGAVALLAVIAIGGYALARGPDPAGTGAAPGHLTPAGVTSRSGPPGPGGSPSAPSRPARQATTPAASGHGRGAARRPPAGTGPGASPTSARPLLVAPGLAPAVTAARPPATRGAARAAAPGPAAVSHAAAVNPGAAAIVIRRFRLVIIRPADCGGLVHVTVTAGPRPARAISCGWAADPRPAAAARPRGLGSRRGAVSVAAVPEASTGASAAADSGATPGSGAGSAGGWHRGAWPPVSWPWAGAPWPGSRWSARPWPGGRWPPR